MYVCVQVSCGGAKAKTSVKKATLNPVFNETLQLNVEDVAEPIGVEVKDHDVVGRNDAIGDAAINLNELQPNQARPPLTSNWNSRPQFAAPRRFAAWSALPASCASSSHLAQPTRRGAAGH